VKWFLLGFFFIFLRPGCETVKGNVNADKSVAFPIALGANQRWLISESDQDGTWRSRGSCGCLARVAAECCLDQSVD
jgi:hypothetical protein